MKRESEGGEHDNKERKGEKRRKTIRFIGTGNRASAHYNCFIV